MVSSHFELEPYKGKKGDWMWPTSFFSEGGGQVWGGQIDGEKTKNKCMAFQWLPSPNKYYILSQVKSFKYIFY